MYDMYPASWRVVDDTERKAQRRRQPRRPDAETRRRAVQEAMNRRDNGGEPAK
jgi:hypothetical protein